MMKMKNSLYRFQLVAIISTLFVFVFYILTLAPGLIASDSGELAAVQCTLGIAHPTGYPLFTILGFIFSKLPLPLKPITKLNLLTAIWSALAVYVLILTIKFTLDNFYKWGVLKLKDSEILNRFNVSENYKILASVFGGLVLGFSKTSWSLSVSIEVYSLHIFLFSLILFFMLKAFVETEEKRELNLFKENWFYAFVFLGLSFTNHLSTIYILPAFAYLYFHRFDFSSKKIKQLVVYSLIAFLIALLIYMYLPIRAKMQPYLNWGNPTTLESFINHVTGRLYHQFLFPSFGEYISNVGFFLKTISVSFDKTLYKGADFSVIIIMSFLGMVAALFFMRKIFNVLILIILTTVLISSLYNIPDIDTYYLPAHLSFSFFAAIGLFYISSIKMKELLKKILIPAIFLLSILILLNFNYSRVDQSENVFLDEYTKDVLDSVDERAIIICGPASFYLYFPSLYYQLVEGYRKDVVVAEISSLQQKWYYNQLSRIHPDVIQLVDTIVTLNYSNRSVYFTPEMIESGLKGEIKFSENLELVPDKYLFKLVPKGKYHDIKIPEYKLKIIREDLHESVAIRNLITNMLLNRAVYELINNKIDRARILLKELKSKNPDYILPMDLKVLLNE